MTNILLDIKTLLPQTEQAIYIGSKPDTPDILVCLYNTGGYPPTNMVSGDVLREPTFQVIVRDTSYENGFNRTEAILNKLNGIVNFSVNGNDYISISSISDILPLGRDDNNRNEFSINFSVVK